MSKVSYPGSSPYSQTFQTSWHIGLYSDRIIARDPGDTLVEIEEGYQYRPDLMSYHYYGTSNYWWVFLARNPDVIRDPIYDHVAGAIIYVPSPSRVKKI